MITTYKVADLSAEAYAGLVASITPLYIWFAPHSTDQDIYARLHQHPETHIDLCIDATTGECLAFSVYYTELFEGLYIMFRGGTVVGRRSRGLYRELLERSIETDQPDMIVAMTQNPRVYETLSSYACDIYHVYPSLFHPVPGGIRPIAEHFCKAPGLDTTTFIVPGVYTGIRTDNDFRTVRSFAIRRMFEAKLGPHDAFFMVVDRRRNP